MAVVRLLAFSLPLLVIITVTARAPADDSKAECVRAFEAAQRARLRSKLVEAKAELRICSRDVCPGLVHDDCTAWLREVEAAMPSVVISVRTSDGEDVPDARVSIDGRPVRLAGTPIELSPGEHSIRVEASERRTLERKLMVNAGEKSRLVSLTLPARARSELGREIRTEPTRPSWPYFVGALGIVAVGAGVTLDVLGSRRLRDLRDDCAPSCSSSDVKSTRTTIIVGDSLIAGGVIALGIAGYGLITGSDQRSEQRAGR
jgi:hypothetical protein